MEGRRQVSGSDPRIRFWFLRCCAWAPGLPCALSSFNPNGFIERTEDAQSKT